MGGGSSKKKYTASGDNKVEEPYEPSPPASPTSPGGRRTSTRDSTSGAYAENPARMAWEGSEATSPVSPPSSRRRSQSSAALGELDDRMRSKESDRRESKSSDTPKGDRKPSTRQESKGRASSEAGSESAQEEERRSRKSSKRQSSKRNSMTGGGGSKEKPGAILWTPGDRVITKGSVRMQKEWGLGTVRAEGKPGTQTYQIKFDNGKEAMIKADNLDAITSSEEAIIQQMNPQQFNDYLQDRMEEQEKRDRAAAAVGK